jgi:hypothetical protein
MGVQQIARIAAQEISIDDCDASIIGKAFAQLDCETIIEFDQDQSAQWLARKPLAQDAEAGANLNHVVAASDFGGLDNSIRNARLHQEILTLRFVRDHTGDRKRAGGA